MEAAKNDKLGICRKYSAVSLSAVALHDRDLQYKKGDGNFPLSAE